MHEADHTHSLTHSTVATNQSPNQTLITYSSNPTEAEKTSPRLNPKLRKLIHPHEAPAATHSTDLYRLKLATLGSCCRPSTARMPFVSKPRLEETGMHLAKGDQLTKIRTAGKPPPNKSKQQQQEEEEEEA